jgi:hypothetical protein
MGLTDLFFGEFHFIRNIYPALTNVVQPGFEHGALQRMYTVGK